MLIELAADTQTLDWGTIIVQSLITISVVFGGAGFWEFIKTKFQAKREDKKAEDNSNDQITKMAGQLTEMSAQMTTLTHNMQDLKDDLFLLQKANEETVKYREIRDTADKEALAIQRAVIESLKSMMRERLLEMYKLCRKKGYYTQEERDVYKPLFDCYISEPFHGNGVMHDLRKFMINLPWTAEDAKRLGTAEEDEAV